MTEPGHDSTGLPRVGAPATRALHAAGYLTLAALAGTSADDLLALHGVGPRAIRIINDALTEAGLPLLR